ncbi:MAG: hypothetical protein KME43_16380 [Myxacorys chilensis ATA2-1-KO14]|jgi:hypothetical protein|nr:hypothetical protein [Myxacorys chilensis ATA2-1-KO14]
MGKKFQVGSGDKVKVYVALLPLGDRTEPITINGIATASGGITANAVTINLGSAVGGVGIAGGTPLLFANSGGTKVKVYLTADAKADDTVLQIEAAAATVAGICTATYVPKLRLLGGTSSSPKISNKTQESLVFEDELGFEDGVVTSANWEIPWTANLLADDDAYRRIYFAATHGTSGREAYIWQYDPPPPGFTTGDGLKGACIVADFSKDLKSDGILSFQTSFKGQGTPGILRYS